MKVESWSLRILDMIRPLILFALFGLFLGGCASISSLQSARALPDGTSRTIIGGGYFTTPSASAVGGEVKFPFLEASYRRGVDEYMEVGGKFTLPSHLVIDAKYQFLDDRYLALAVGLGFGYLVASTEMKATTNQYTNNFLDIFVPFYASYDFNPILGAYLSPRYIFRAYTGSGVPNGHLAGAALGFKFGNKAGVMLESAFLKGISDAEDQFQITTAVFFGDGGFEPGVSSK